MSNFTKLPQLIGIPPEYKLFKVPVSFEYYIGIKGANNIIEIPKGFICDGASIPKIFWSVVGNPLGKYAPAAVIHDFLYRYQIRSRKESDEIFYEAMQVLKVPFWKRWIMYHAVRTCAWRVWNKRKRELESI